MSPHFSAEALERPHDLPADQRRALLEHVSVCSSCREAFVAREPSRVFAILAVEPIPEEVLEDVSRSVAADIGGAIAAPERFRGSWRPAAVAAWAAGLVLAAGLFLLTADWAPGPLQVQGPSGEEATLEPGATVALIESPGDAQVVDLTVGATQVVMIFDEELDL